MITQDKLIKLSNTKYCLNIGGRLALNLEQKNQLH